MAWLSDALVLLGLAVMTIGVLGLYRLPGLYLKLHAASKAVVLGVAALALSTVASGDPAVIARVVLIVGFLLLTSPVAAHAIARAAYRAERRRHPT